MPRSRRAAEMEITRLRDIPYGSARVRAAEAEVARTEAEGPIEVMPYALFTLVESYTFSTEARKGFVPFTRMLRLFDDHPEYFDSYDRHSVYWAYKWMVGDLMEFPEVPADQIDSTLADMRERYQLAGNGMNAVHLMEFYWARHRDRPETEQLYGTWISTPRDDFAQCEVCDPGDRAEYLAETGRISESIELIEKTLPSGKTCASEPCDMLSRLAVNYLDAGRADEAAAVFYRAVDALRETSGPMSSARGLQLVFLARTAPMERGVRHLLDNEGLLLDEGATPARTYRYFLRVGGATRVWLNEGMGNYRITFRHLPPMDIKTFHDWALDKAIEIGTAFDQRNGEGSFVSRAKAAFADAAPKVPLDLGVFGLARDDDDLARDTDPIVLLNRAEYAAPRDLQLAARLYLRAADGFDSNGDRERAGFAMAEAAHCAQVLGDLEGAAVTYHRALTRLAEVGTDIGVLIPVVLAHVASLADAGYLGPASEVIDRWMQTAGEQPPANELPSLVHLELQEAKARLLATQGEYGAAIAAAREVGEAFALLDESVREANCLVLQGRLLREHQGDAAGSLAPLSRAFEIYGRGTATRIAHREAGQEYMAALRAVGRDDEAQEIAAQIS